MYPPPRVNRLHKAALIFLVAASAAVFVCAQASAFEITMTFGSTDVVEGEYHSGWIDATEPFSRVEWWVDGALAETNYATLDTQTYNSFGTDFIGLGSESGNEVVIYALAYARNSSDTANAQHTVTVTASAESDDDENGDESDGENGGESDDSSEELESVQSTYPIIETSARCIHEGDYLHPAVQILDHTMTVKVEPSYVGDPNENYTKGEIWKAKAKAEITRTRPLGETCVGRDARFGWCKRAVFNPVNDVFTDNQNVTVRADVYVKVEGRWIFKLEAQLNVVVAEIGPEVGYQTGYKTYPHKIEWWTGSSRSVTSDVLRGAGVPEEDCNYYSPLQAETNGTAKAEWIYLEEEPKLDAHGNPQLDENGEPVMVETYTISPGRREIKDPAEVTHISPDQSGTNDTCTNTYIKPISPVPY